MTPALVVLFYGLWSMIGAMSAFLFCWQVQKTV